LGIADCGLRILKKQKTTILLWERLPRPELACSELAEWSKDSRDFEVSTILAIFRLLLATGYLM
jgi:hypothetical protein